MLSNEVASASVSISVMDPMDIVSLCSLAMHTCSSIPEILRSHDLCFKCLPRKSTDGDLPVHITKCNTKII